MFIVEHTVTTSSIYELFNRMTSSLAEFAATMTSNTMAIRRLEESNHNLELEVRALKERISELHVPVDTGVTITNPASVSSNKKLLRILLRNKEGESNPLISIQL